MSEEGFRLRAYQKLSKVVRTFFRISMSLCLGPALLCPNALAATHTTDMPYVALGDSIPFGYNLGDNKAPSPLAYPYLIGKQNGWHVANLAVPGSTSSDLLSALNRPAYESQIKQAKVITMDIGSNDLLHAMSPLLAKAGTLQPLSVTTSQAKKLQSVVAQFTTNEAKIVGKIRTLTCAPVILMTLYNPFPDGTSLAVLTNQLESPMNRVIRLTAAENALPVVDTYALIQHKQSSYIRVAFHDIHPTALGQKVISNGVEAVLKNPLAHVPLVYAIAKSKSVVYEAPQVTSMGIHILEGSEGDVVTGQFKKWIAVVTPAGLRGYTLTSGVTLLLRPNGYQTFQSSTAFCRVGTLTAQQKSQRVVQVHGVWYAPLKFIGGLVGAGVDWDPLVRVATITSSTQRSRPAKKVEASLWSSTSTKKYSVQTKGILVNIDGEPLNSTAEPLFINGQLYVPLVACWEGRGGDVKPGTHGLQLLFEAGS